MGDVILHHNLGEIRPDDRFVFRPGFSASIEESGVASNLFHVGIITAKGQHWNIRDRPMRAAHNFIRFRFDCYVNANLPQIFAHKPPMDLVEHLIATWALTHEEAIIVMKLMHHAGFDANPGIESRRGHTIRGLLIGARLLDMTGGVGR